MIRRTVITTFLLFLSMIRLHPQLDFISARGEIRTALVGKDHPVSAAACDYFAANTNKIKYLSNAERQQLTRDLFWYMCAPYAGDLARYNPSKQTLNTLPELLLNHLNTIYTPEFFFFHCLAYMMTTDLAAQVNNHKWCQAQRTSTQWSGPNGTLRLTHLTTILAQQHLAAAQHGNPIIKNALTFLLEHAADDMHDCIENHLSMLQKTTAQRQHMPWYTRHLHTILKTVGSCCSDRLAENDMRDIIHEHIRFNEYVQFDPAHVVLQITSEEEKRWKNNRYVF